MNSSSVQPDSKFIRSSRVLGNSNVPAVAASSSADFLAEDPHLHLLHRQRSINEPSSLINNELQIHQKTAELSSIDFGSAADAVTAAENHDQVYNFGSAADLEVSNNDFLDDANSHYFPQPTTTTNNNNNNNNNNNSFSYNPYHGLVPYKQNQQHTQNITESTPLIDDQPQDLESFNAILGNNPNAAGGSSSDYFEFNQNLNNSDTQSISKTSSILNFTKKLNRSVSNKLLSINGSSNKDSSAIADDQYNAGQYYQPNQTYYSINDNSNNTQLQNTSNPFAKFSFFFSSDSGNGNGNGNGKLNAISGLASESLNLLLCVFLGLLLNVLDALSYGMIIFPINKPLFADLGPSGLSMFYVSCVVSQLTYSLGGSVFKSAVGSEMIEVTPFFHSMAISIMNSIGTDDETLVNKDSIVATTIICYCFSTLLTGLVFFSLGYFKLGQLIGFFPRHILIGSIGGVGYFLLVTGIEVTSRLTTTFSYNWETISFLFSGLNFVKWFSSLMITVVLVLIQRFNKKLASFSLLLPVYFIAIFALIHLLIWAVPEWDLQSARDNGFIFDVASSSATSSVDPAIASGKESWYHFYTLFKFRFVRWDLIFAQLPSMLALTFFGMLHVPINVPALAISVQKDDIDLNRELIAHGYSNFLSGCIGSIQNYLVYSNSLLFIRSGAGDKRLAGILLALCTAIVMFIGPILIKFIPVCVVGSLIFLLGYELLKESLYDSYAKLSTFDYSTIIVIILTMGLWDFVYGILLGVLIAFISFVVENANQNPIKKIFTGAVVRSTIKRNHLTNTFLKNVGSQTLIVKLQGNIFFGSIGKIEQEIKKCFQENDEQNEFQFRYLILDLGSVLSVDYTAAEGFQGIKNFADKSNAYLIIASINSDSIFQSLFNVGLINENSAAKDGSTQLFHDLNSALEWCENEYLISIYDLRNARYQQQQQQQQQRQRPRVGSFVSNRSVGGTLIGGASSGTATGGGYGTTSTGTGIVTAAATSRQKSNTLAVPSSSTGNITGGVAGLQHQQIPQIPQQQQQQQEDYKYNLTESYLNPMSLINNPSGFGSPRQRDIIKAITKSVNEEGGPFGGGSSHGGSTGSHDNHFNFNNYSSNNNNNSYSGSHLSDKFSTQPTALPHQQAAVYAANAAVAESSANNSATPPRKQYQKELNGNLNTSTNNGNNPCSEEDVAAANRALLKLIKSTFKGISHKPECFWEPLLPFLKPVTILKETSYYPQLPKQKQPKQSSTNFSYHSNNNNLASKNSISDGDAKNSSTSTNTSSSTNNALPANNAFQNDDSHGGFFFIIESGLIQFDYDYGQGRISETLVPKTAFGSLGIKHSGSVFGRHANAKNNNGGGSGIAGIIGRNDSTRNLKITALKDSKIWKLSYEDFKKLTKGAAANSTATDAATVNANAKEGSTDAIIGGGVDSATAAATAGDINTNQATKSNDANANANADANSGVNDTALVLLVKNGNEIANELLMIEINLLSERFDKITSFILISS